MWTRRIIEFGDSLSLNLPAQYCREFGIHRGDTVTVWLGQDGFLRVGKIDLARRPDLNSEDPESMPVIK